MNPSEERVYDNSEYPVEGEMHKVDIRQEKDQYHFGIYEQEAAEKAFKYCYTFMKSFQWNCSTDDRNKFNRWRKCNKRETIVVKNQDASPRAFALLGQRASGNWYVYFMSSIMPISEEPYVAHLCHMIPDYAEIKKRNISIPQIYKDNLPQMLTQDEIDRLFKETPITKDDIDCDPIVLPDDALQPMT